MRKSYPTFPKLTNLIVWQEPDPGLNALYAAFTHLKAVEVTPPPCGLRVSKETPPRTA
jgi:hypothetical protein